MREVPDVRRPRIPAAAEEVHQCRRTEATHSKVAPGQTARNRVAAGLELATRFLTPAVPGAGTIT
jgi:hypothetical protein